MNIRTNLVIAALVIAAGTSRAAAQSFDDAVDVLLDRRTKELAKTIAKQALRRGRRAFALGPFAAGAAAISTEGGDVEAQVGGGLALVRYDIEIFIKPAQIAEMMKARAKALVLERFASGTAPTRADLERLLAEVVDDVIAELTRALEPRRFERPRFRASLEVDHLTGSGAWDLRATFGFGVSRVFLAAGVVGQFDDGFALVVPVEISVPMLLSDGLRSPAIDWFARYDIAATGRDERLDRVMLGARMMLDVI